MWFKPEPQLLGSGLGSNVARLSEWINDPPFPENTGKGLEMWQSEWLV